MSGIVRRTTFIGSLLQKKPRAIIDRETDRLDHGIAACKYREFLFTIPPDGNGYGIENQEIGEGLAMLRASMALLVCLSGWGMAGTAAAQTGFKVCNRSSLELSVAKALNMYDSKKSSTYNIISEGWYQIPVGKCVTLWPGKLEFRYYTLYARARQGSREWSGNIPICVSDRTFTHTASKVQGVVCSAGHYTRNFFQVDTGDDDGFTYNFE